MKRRFLLPAIFSAILFTGSVTAGPEEGLFNAAKTMIANAQALPDDEKLSNYRSAKELLDLIASAYGESEIGQSLSSGGVVQGVDIDALNDALTSGRTDATTPVLVDLGSTIVTASKEPEPGLIEGVDTSDSLSDDAAGTESLNLVPLSPIDTEGQAAPVAPSTMPNTGGVFAGLPNTSTSVAPSAETAVRETAPFLPETAETLAPEKGTEATEAALNLKKQDIRDLQARLLVMGHDPNGIDGQIGRGTRGALRDWQQVNGIEPTGYLRDTQKDLLNRQSEPQLTAWLQDPDNARAYDPPVIAIGPGNIPGTWRYTTNCGSNSKLGKVKITGVLAIAHSGGNRYSGNVRQSQGFRGKFSGTLRGRQMSATVNWGLLLGKVQVTGRVADEKLVISGRDSNRCSFYAWKA